MSLTISLEGFTLNIVSIIPDNLLCSLCSNILDNPHQAPCGCRFCYGCISNYLENNEGICPGKTEDCMEINLNIERDLIPDILAKRKISRVIVKCPLYSCDQECELCNMKDHLSECISSTIMCGKCNETIRRGKFENHEREECKEGIVICEFCNVKMKRKILKEEHQNYDHKYLCDLYSNYCPKLCGESEKVIWSKHRKVCKMRYVECPYKKLGCRSGPLKAMDISVHFTENTSSHIDGLLKEINNLRYENQTLKNMLINVNNEMKIMKKKCNEHENDIKKLKSEISIMSEKMKDMKESHIESILDLRCKIKDEILSSSNVQSISISEMVEEMKEVKNQVEILKKECERIKETKIMYKSKTLIPLTKNLRKNGIFLDWKIEDFNMIHFLDSPFFYINEKGYKMDLSLEKKKKGYLSIYARLYGVSNNEEFEQTREIPLFVRIIDQDYIGRDYNKTIIIVKEGEKKYLSAPGKWGYSNFIKYEELRSKPYLLKGNTLIINVLLGEVKTLERAAINLL